jgi:hypothetical protein
MFRIATLFSNNVNYSVACLDMFRLITRLSMLPTGSINKGKCCSSWPQHCSGPSGSPAPTGIHVPIRKANRTSVGSRMSIRLSLSSSRPRLRGVEVNHIVTVEAECDGTES